MDVLHRFTGDAAEFIDALRHRTPRVFRPADPPLDLLAPGELDRWLDSGLLRLPYVQLVTADGEVPLPRYCPPRTVVGRIEHGYVDGAAVRGFLAEGTATVLLRHIDQWHPAIRTFCEAMRSQLGRQVEAFHFVTPPGTQGRPVHRDDADVFVVQTAGTKTWHLYDAPGDGRWGPGAVDLPGRPEFTTRLEPGQVLYVPRGQAHSAVAADSGVCAHLSFTVREAGGAHLRAGLAALLAETDLPARPLGEKELLAAAERLLAESRAALATLTAEDLVHRARTGMRAVASPPDSRGRRAERPLP
ncbi:cupin domain-containing protein [Streptomyces avidinii]|uniref:JmjC domain-containing protein n=1 Tax=Streptomyces avidinii TaxID=1895 RepID=UPI0038634BA7|nr:cupin domain-containing protein [Streptomyces avidinii]